MSFIENNLPTPTDDTNNLLRKMLNVLLGGLSGGGSVTGSVAINDGTVAATKAKVTNAAAAADDYGLVVRVAGDTGGAITIADGADIALGAKADAFTTDPTATKSLIAISKGILAFNSTTAGFSENISNYTFSMLAVLGTTADAAQPLPGPAATIPSSLKGILSLITTGNGSLSSILSTAGVISSTLSTLNNKFGSLGQKTMAGSQPVVIASDQTAVPVSITGTGAFTGNITQWAGTAVDTNSGNKSAGTLRVVLATDQPSLSNALAVSQSGTWNIGSITTLPSIPTGANVIGAVTQSAGPWTINQTQWAGTAVDTNSGNKSAGTLRVVLATDQVAMTNAQPSNQTQINGTAVDVNAGTKSAGTQRMTLATDQTTLTNTLAPVSTAFATATTGTLTGAGSVTATSIGNYPTALVSIHGTYGISTGVFEASDDAGTTWYPVFGVRSDLNIIDAGFTSIPANTSRMWTVPLNGANQFRVRATAVASGTISVSVTPIAAAVSDGSVVAVTPSQGTLTDKSGTISSGGAAQTLAAANTSRKYLLIVNVSAETLWINFTTAAVQTQPSVPIVPNGSYVMEASYISTELISIIGATTGSAFTAKEG